MAERDVLGLPVARQPFDSTGLLDELEKALGPLKKQKKCCINESDGAYQTIEELEERVQAGEAAHRAPALEVFMRRTEDHRAQRQPGRTGIRRPCVPR